jgi:predicted enzyme related to lactoylglutathione lyase
MSDASVSRRLVSPSPQNKEMRMNHGIKTIIVPVKDLAAAKALYTALLGVEPYSDAPYYVGFRVGEQEIGLDPNGHNNGLTGPIGYSHVDDIEASLKALLDAGARVEQTVNDVGGGRLIASVRDIDGNVIGVLQDPQR